jgi:hypothetical protein
VVAAIEAPSTIAVRQSDDVNARHMVTASKVEVAGLKPILSFPRVLPGSARHKQQARRHCLLSRPHIHPAQRALARFHHVRLVDAEQVAYLSSCY